MTIVIIGGTGMLLPAAKELSEQGLEVAVVARHASDVVRTVATELIIPIDADWSEPEKYLDTVRSAMQQHTVTGMITWIHRPYRDQLMLGLAELVEPGGRIVRLWGSSSGDPATIAARSPRPKGFSLCEVYLGANRQGNNMSWLSHEQISRGALEALRGEMSELTVGVLPPYPEHNTVS